MQWSALILIDCDYKKNILKEKSLFIFNQTSAIAHITATLISVCEKCSTLPVRLRLFLRNTNLYMAPFDLACPSVGSGGDGGHFVHCRHVYSHWLSICGELFHRTLLTDSWMTSCSPAAVHWVCSGTNRACSRWFWKLFMCYSRYLCTTRVIYVLLRYWRYLWTKIFMEYRDIYASVDWLGPLWFILYLPVCLFSSTDGNFWDYLGQKLYWNGTCSVSQSFRSHFDFLFLFSENKLLKHKCSPFRINQK